MRFNIILYNNRPPRDDVAQWFPYNIITTATNAVTDVCELTAAVTHLSGSHTRLYTNRRRRRYKPLNDLTVV